MGDRVVSDPGRDDGGDRVGGWIALYRRDNEIPRYGFFTTIRGAVADVCHTGDLSGVSDPREDRERLEVESASADLRDGQIRIARDGSVFMVGLGLLRALCGCLVDFLCRHF